MTDGLQFCLLCLKITEGKCANKIKTVVSYKTENMIYWLKQG